MKVVILKTGEIKEIAAGYARNYLFPNKLAVIATAGKIKQAEEKRKKIAAKQEKNKADEERLINSLKNVSLSITVKTNDDGKMFAALNIKDINEAIFKQLKVNIPDKWINIDETIKELGDYQITIESDQKFTTKIKVKLIK